jgi:glycosyltransferase involved in cell wall biosynthesis
VRIGLDATAVDPAEGFGIHTYALNLTKSLLEIDTRNEYIIYCRREVPEAFQAFASRAEFKVCGLRKRKACEQLWLPFVAPFDSLDAFHCLCSLPPIAPQNSVLSVLGLSWRVSPEVFSKPQLLYWRHCAERTMRKAKRLIAISEWSKGMVTRELGIPESRVDVAHLGADLGLYSQTYSADELAQLRNRHSLPDRFILFVGGMLPVKNLTRLIRAFHRLVESGDHAGRDLVIAGGKGWGYQPVFDLVEELRLKDRVVFTGFFPAEDLPALYQAADVFVLPSLYEGFGLPIVESFASRTPVVTSNVSCLPEIAGDAAVLIDPTDENQIADAISNVIQDQALREDLIEKGVRRAKNFTWKKTAENTLACYETMNRDSQNSTHD